MAKYSNTVEYNIRTTLDNSGIAKLQSELTQLQNKINTMGAKGLLPESAITKTLADIKKVQTALTNAFNPKLGMLNTSKFMSEIKAAGLSMNGIYKSFSQAGAAGTRAFTSMYGQISKIDTGLRSVSKTTDKIFNTMGNTFRWGIIASGFAGMMNSIHEAAEYTKDLDKSLTNIMMVSGETRDNMNEYARIANQVAQQLGSTTVAMTDATQVFIQQGYDLQKSQQLATYSTVLANVSQQDTATASDEITAYMNAYKIPLEDIGNALSKWAEVANVSAADVEELSVASQKAASVATTVGVDMDQLAATIATIETVTREAPENIGNGLKTIYSRLSDIKLGETLEDGVNLGQITSALSKVGVQVLDDAGKMRDVGSIVEDLMDVWGTLDQTQKAATATTLAGRFQLARFEALMNRSDLYKQYLGSSRAQTGTETLDFMQETYQESLEGRLNTLQSKVEEIFLDIFESSSFNGAVDALSGLVDVLNDLIKATGSGENALLGITALLTRLASGSVARGLANTITNFQAERAADKNIVNAQKQAQNQLLGLGLNTTDTRLQNFATSTANINKNASLMNDETMRQSNELIDKRVQTLNQLSAAEEKQREGYIQLRGILQALGDTEKLTDAELERQIELITLNSETETNLSSALKDLRKQHQNLAGAMTNAVEIIESIGKQGNYTQKELEQLAKSCKNVSNGAKILAKMGLLSTEALEKLHNIEKVIIDTQQNQYQTTEEVSLAYRELAIALTEVDAALQDSSAKTEKIVADTNEATNAAVRLTEADKMLAGEQEFLATRLNLTSMINGVINFGNAIISVMFTVQSLSNLMEVLSDDTKSPFEKLEAGAMDFGLALVMVGPLIKNVIEWFKDLRTAVKATTIEQAGMAVVNAALTGSLEGLGLAELIVIKNTYGWSAALKSLWVSLAPILTAAAPFIAIAAAIAASVGLIVYLVGEAEKSYNRFDTAVETATKHVEQANTAYKRSTELITEIDSALSKLDENPFEGLTRGTTEWVEALQNANNAVLDVIDKYPELAQYVEHDRDTGALTFNEKGLKAQREIALEQQAGAAAMMVAAKEEEAAAKATQKSVNLARSEGNKFSALKTYATTSTSIGADANGGTIYQDFYSEEKAGAVIEKAALYMAEHADASAEELATAINAPIEVAEELVGSVGDLGQELQANTVALREVAQTYASQVLAGNNKYDNASPAVQNIIDNQLAAIFTNKNSQQYTDAQAEVNKMSEAAKKEKYAAQMGYYIGKNGEYYTSKEARDSGDESGKIKWENIDIDGALISEAIAVNIRNNANDFITPIQNAYQQIVDNVGEGFAQSLSIDGEGNGSFNSNITNLLIGKQLDLSAIWEENQEQLQKLGFDSYNEFVKAFMDAAAANPIDIYSLFTHISGDKRETILKDSGLDESSFSSYVESFKEMGGAGAVVDDNVKTIAEENKTLETNVKKWKDRQKELENTSNKTEEQEAELEQLKKKLENGEKALDHSNKEIEDMALRCIETNTGLDELAENWEKIEENINSTDFTKQTQGFTDLDSAVSKILNIEPGTLDRAFYTDPSNMEIIQELMQGNLDRLDEFRVKAAERILIRMELDENVQAEAAEVVAMAEAALPDLEVGAYLETGPFIDGLNALISSGKMTSDQLNSILGTMGFEIEPLPAELPFESIAVSAGNVLDSILGKFTGVNFNIGQRIQARVTGFRVKRIGGGGSPGYNSRPSSGSGGGGGGGGGGDKSKSVDKNEGAKSTDDIYNKINATLDKLSDNYTKIDKAKGRVYGDKYRKAAEAELANLIEQNEALQERVDISEKYAEALRTGQDNVAYGIYLEGESLKKYGLLDSDSNGVIDNYIEVYNKAKAAEIAAQKAADDYWNSTGGTMSEDQQNHYNDLVEKQKDAADYANKITDLADKYQETCDKIRDDTQQINDNLYEMEDIQIDLFKTAVDTVDSIKDLHDEMSWLQGFYTGLNEDSPFRKMIEDASILKTLLDGTKVSANEFFADMIAGAEDAATTAFWTQVRDQAANKFGNGTSILDMRQFYLEALLSDEGKAIFGSNAKEYQEMLESLHSEVIGDLKDIESSYDDLLDDILDGYGEIKDAMDRRIDQEDYLLDSLEHERSIIEMIHGDESYGLFGIINEATVVGTLQKVEEARRNLDYWTEQRNKFDRETQKELWEAMDENVQEFSKTLQEATEASAEAMIQQYNDATDKIIQDFRDKLFGGTIGDAEFFDKEWEMATDLAEQYLDTVEAAYEKDKIRAKYQKMLDQTNDLLTQNKIKQAMQEQLEALENQKKAIINNEGELEYVNALSQFDVDLANAKIEALQKQIALEDAQRNKNQMQLRRDTQGNYRYVYTANQDDILSAQEELADSEYEIYRMSKERYGDVLNERWALQQEYEDKIRWARERYKDDTNKLYTVLNEINEWYTERQVNLGLELQDAQAGMIEGVEHLAESTSDYVSQVFEDISQDMQNNWAECMDNIGVAYSATLADLTEDTAAFKAEVDGIHTEIVEAAEDFNKELGDLEITAQTSFSNIRDNIAPINQEMEELNRQTDEFLSMISADTGRIDEGAQQLENYRKEIEKLKNSESALANTLAQTQAARDAALAEAQNYKTQYTQAKQVVEDIKSGKRDKNGNLIQTSSGSSSGGLSRNRISDIFYLIHTGQVGNEGDRTPILRSRGYSDREIRAGQKAINLAYLSDYANEDAISWAAAHMKTGGYTGKWGPGGKAAILHEKELVLNANDTENMLAAVDIVRGIVDTLKASGYSTTLTSLGKTGATLGDTIEQRVAISAEFPNATDADDIRAALIGLADNAYQYAYKTKGK